MKVVDGAGRPRSGADVRLAYDDLEVDVDLRKAGIATIEVEVPEGHERSLVALRIDGDGLGRADVTLRKHEGHARGAIFRVLVPGDRTLRFIPVHPLLGAATTATLDRPGEATVRMRPAPLIRLRALSPQGTGESGGQVELWRGGERVFRRRAHWNGREADGVAGWKAGTYTLVVRYPFVLPIIVENFRLPPEGADLGEIELVSGTTVRFRFEGLGGMPVPDFVVRSVDRAYDRQRVRTRRARATGLAKGAYVAELDWNGRRIESPFTVRGTKEAEHVIDLR